MPLPLLPPGTTGQGKNYKAMSLSPLPYTLHSSPSAVNILLRGFHRILMRGSMALYIIFLDNPGGNFGFLHEYRYQRNSSILISPLPMPLNLVPLLYRQLFQFVPIDCKMACFIKTFPLFNYNPNHSLCQAS